MKHKGVKYYQKTNFNIVRKLTFIALSLCVSVACMLHLSAKWLYPTFLNYAKMQTNKLSTALVNKAIQTTILKDLKEDEIVEVTFQENGVASSVEFNTYSINKITSKVSSSVYSHLKYVEEGNIEKIEYDKLGLEVDSNLLSNGIIYEIPYGMALNNALLANLGPRLPVRFTLLGEITSQVVCEVTQYGINNQVITYLAMLPAYGKLFAASAAGDTLPLMSLMMPAFIAILITTIILAIAMYFINIHMMTKKLNLE